MTVKVGDFIYTRIYRLSLSLSLSYTHAHTRTRTHTHTHSNTLMGLDIKIPFTSHTIDSLIDALLVQNNEKLGNVLKPILHFVVGLHFVALLAWIVLLVRQKPPRVRDKVDLSKES